MPDGSCLSFLILAARARVITITTRPPDANIKIDGVDRGRPITDKFVFEKATRSTRRRPGLKDRLDPRRDFKAIS
jgi:hypothetical protein